MIELNPFQRHVEVVHRIFTSQLSQTDTASRPIDSNNGSSISTHPQAAARREERSYFHRAVRIFFHVVTYPFYFIYKIVSYPFVLLTNLIKDKLHKPPPRAVIWSNLVPRQQESYSDSVASQISADIKRVAQHYMVNINKIKQAPELVNLQAVFFHLQAQGAGNIQLDELLEHFDRVFAGMTQMNRQNLFVDGEHVHFGAVIQGTPCIRSILREYLKFVKDRVEIYGITHPSYFDEMTLMLQGIIFQLRNPNVNIEKKRQLLFELSKGFECAPRRYTEIEKRFRDIYNLSETVDHVLRRWFMDFKHELILERFQRVGSTEFHVLSAAIDAIGDEWGLKDGLSLGDRDPFRRITHRCNPQDFIFALERGCIPERLIHYMEAKMDLERDASGRPVREEMVIDFWRGELAKAMHNGSVSEEAAQGNLYPYPNQALSAEGIAFLLDRAGYLIRI